MVSNNHQTKSAQSQSSKRSSALIFLLSAFFMLALPLLIFWLADEVAEGDVRTFDDSIRNFLHSFADPTLTLAARFVSFIGSPIFLTFTGLIVVGTLFFKNKRNAALVFSVTMVGEIAMSFFLKGWFHRIRPVPFFDYALPDSYSFPSGHAFGSFCFFGILAWMALLSVNSFRARVVISLSTISLILLIGLSRIYLGVHFPSDVLAGFVAGGSWVGIVALANRYFYSSKKND